MLSQKKYLQLYRPKIPSVGIRQRKGVIAAERWWGVGNGDGGFGLYAAGARWIRAKTIIGIGCLTCICNIVALLFTKHVRNQ